MRVVVSSVYQGLRHINMTLMLTLFNIYFRLSGDVRLMREFIPVDYEDV